MNGTREAAWWLAQTREPAPRRTGASATPPRTSRLRSLTVERTAAQLLADARQLYGEGRHAEARLRLLRVVGGAALADEGHYGLACIAVAHQDFATARSHLVRALAVNPRHRSAARALKYFGS